jgi:hypothetical protein
MMVAFIDAHRAEYGVEPICAQLPIAPATYYEQKARQADPTRLPRRTQRYTQLKPEIERVWRANRRVFGDTVIASAILDRLLHHATTINIKGESYRLKEKRRAGLLRPAATPDPAE